MTQHEGSRARLAEALKWDDVPNVVWKNLLKRKIVQDVEKGELNWKDLLFEARVQLETYRETREEEDAQGSAQPNPRIRKPSKEIEPKLGAYEQDRAEALGEYIALRASLDSHVRYFRKVVLGGKLLTPEQSRTFVQSAANRCFDIAWFVKRRISMSEHYSHDYSDGWAIDEDGLECRFDDIYVNPPGEVFRKVTYEPLDFSHRDILSVRHLEEIPVEVGSVLDVLRKVSGRLAEFSARAWGEAEAAWFVLTGEATPVVALAGRIDTFPGGVMWRGTITLTAEIWVPAETVLRYYREMQKDVLEGRDNRPLSARSLALFRFVAEQVRNMVPEVERPDYEAFFDSDREVDVTPSEEELQASKRVGAPSWRALQQRWNGQCSDQKWRYEDVRNFRRAVLNAARLMLGPPYEDHPWMLRFYTSRTLP
jgi:hypothetical protein